MISHEQSAFKVAVEVALLQEGATELNFTGDDNKAEWHFNLFRDGLSWPVYLRAYNWSLVPLPYLHWEVHEPVWGWPHTGADGSICAFDSQGLDYDAEDTTQVVQAIIHKSMRMLIEHHAMSKSERLSAFADELEAYTRNIGIPSLTLDAPLGKNKRVHAYVFPVEKGVWKIERINSHESIGEAQRHSFFVLDVNIDNLPPLINNPGSDWWLELCKSIPVKQRLILERKRGCGVILRVNNRFGGAHILLYWGNQARGQQFKFYRLEPVYHEYLTRRVGLKSLARRIAVIGVGAVGSRVAEHLALSGVKNLTLVDSDKLSANNLGRHVLSRHFIGMNKAKSLATHLRGRMPGIDVNPCDGTVEDWLKTANPNEFDVIIFATGNIAGERLLFRRAWREGWVCKLISTFVEAANLGGHAIAMQPGERGCLECLYEIEDPITVGSLRTGMLEPGQSPSQEISGCGAFTPYSAITATRTALLATELSLPNAEVGYHRWAGSDDMAVALNLYPSEFWHALRNSKVATFISRDIYARNGCPCCSH